MPRRNWTRDETLIALNVYCRTPFGRLSAGNPEIVEVATALGRTPAALAMNCCNLAGFDAAHQARGVTGLQNAARLDSQIWNEFQNNPEEIAFEAEQAYARLMRRELRLAETVEWEEVQGLDKAAVTKVRVSQQFFRSLILAGYRTQCAICELPISTLLVASHIVPWSVDKSQRMNPRNGICLCSIHDRAFDRNLLSISPEYEVQVHKDVESYRDVQAVSDYLLRFAGRSLVLPERWRPDPDLLRRGGDCGGVPGRIVTPAADWERSRPNVSRPPQRFPRPAASGN